MGKPCMQDKQTLKALGIDEDSIYVWSNNSSAISTSNTSDLEKAENYLKQAYHLDHNNVNALCCYGDVLFCHESGRRRC